MKKFFRLVSMLAVAGLTFAYTSCTDYSEDVNRLDERIDGHVADVNTQIDELKKTDEGLQSSINAANDAIKALQDNTASLKEELTKLSEKHDADIKALEATHAADKAALETQLADKATELKTALETLDAKYAQKVSDLEAAYKQADVELKNQIAQNTTKITTLESDVKKINDEVIPTVKKQIEDLAKAADETYATKVELTQATAKVTELVNSEVAKLTTRLESVESRLTTLEAAHKTLKESFEQTSEAHAAAIKTLETNVATLTGDVAELKTAVKAAKGAADAAQEAADAAQAAADKAQETADAAVTAAANAQKAAEAAQATATEALGKVDDLIEALGVYAQKGVLEAKIGEIVEKTIALTNKDIELDGRIDNLATTVADLSEELQTQVKEIYAYVDVQDAKKLNIADFADAFKAAYEARFADDFAGAWAETFQPAFDEAFKAAWAETFQPAFDEAFTTAWEKNFQSSFDDAFNTAIAKAIEDDGVVSAKIKEEVNAAKTELECKIQAAESKLQAQLDIVNTKVGDIILVVGDLAERIQSITFVPEYEGSYGVGQFAATLYYYWTRVQVADGETVDVNISNTKTVVAKFEVYPKSQAAKVAEMLKSGEGASLVAVPLKAAGTRGAAEATKAKIKSAVADNGVVSIEAVFGAEVNYYYDVENPEKDAVSFAIALRVESPAETVVRDGVTETSGTSVDAGKYIESAYVPVEKSKYSKVEGFFLYDFENEKEFESTSIKKQWSAAPAKWNYFAGYDYAVRMYDRAGKECVMTLAEAADLMNVDVETITPSFTVNAEVNKKDAEKFFDPKAEKKVVKFDALADCYIAMNETAVKADVKNAVGSNMKHCVDFKIANIGSVCHYDVNYEIIRRQVDFNLKPYDSNEIAWTYAKAVELSSDKTFAKAYDQPLVFNECGVERVDENNTLKVKLGEILKLTPKYEVTINGDEASVINPIEITMVAQDVEDVAKVVIPGGAYEFAQGKDNNYVIKAVYAVDDNQTVYNVFFEYKLGAMPEDQTVNLPAKALTFTSGQPDFSAKYTESEYRKPLVDAIGSYFKDAKTLWTSVNENEVVKDVTLYYNKSKRDTNSSTYLNVLETGVSVVVDRLDLKSFDDKFGFTAVNKTWYGVDYTFKTAVDGITFAKPSYVLAPAPDRLNDDWTGTINYQETTARYILQQDIDLSKYVIVKDSKDASKALTETALTIDYAALTKTDEAKGILRVPAIATPSVKVIPSTTTPQFPTIEESMINWLTTDREASFTARELEISALLKLEGIELDKQTIKLSTARPITNFSFDNFVETVTTKNATVELWRQMVIEGVREPGLNIVNQKAASFELAMKSKPVGVKAFQGPYSYDCVVTFPDKKDVVVFVGGEKQNIYNQEKFEYDPVNGTITFTGDLGDLVKPVEFKFTATLNYVLDYNHKQPMTAPVSVTFQKK